MLPLFARDPASTDPEPGAVAGDRPPVRRGTDPEPWPGRDATRPDRAVATTLEPPRREATAETEPPVEIRVSRRRRKTATAFWEAGRIVVVVPSHVQGRDRQEIVEWLVTRARAKRPGMGTGDHALAGRAAVLADRYVDGVRPTSIRWVTNQNKRWGSCSAHSGEIRLSHRLQPVPEWVLDAIIVHELAHLVLPDHSPRFHEIAGRYPRQSEAALFLEGYQLGLGHDL
jgi:hypothetical protein